MEVDSLDICSESTNLETLAIIFSLIGHTVQLEATQSEAEIRTQYV